MIALGTSLLIAFCTGSAHSWFRVPDSEVIQVREEDGEVAACLPFAFIGVEPGAPDLPSYPEWITLPAGEVATRIEVSEVEWGDLPGDWLIRPLPAPEILSLPAHVSAQRDEVIYGTDGYWPGTTVELTGTGYRDGVPSAEILVHPLRYNPVTRHMQRLLSFGIEVETSPGDRGTPVPTRVSDRDLQVRMLIVTGEPVRAPFDSLAAWRTGGGMPTEVVTTGEIYSSTPGADDAERIRNYIKSRWLTDGIDFVLLGGDVGIVPCRFVFVINYQFAGGIGDIRPSDLYFSDLDGTWNRNGNNIWGELADSLDLYPDVSVGRASVEDIDEAWGFVNKVIAYETADITDHLDDALMMAGTYDPETDGAVQADWIVDNCIPPFFTVTKQYQSMGTYGLEQAISALEQGTSVLCIISHGATFMVGPMDNEDVDGIDSNGRFYGMASTTGCWTNAFDGDAISEHLITNPVGGGVSYIGNTSFGWGSPGNPLFGYSDRMNRELFSVAFEDPTLSLGEIVSEAKESYIPFSHQQNVYRCVVFILNLLGDPSMVIHRMPPVQPTIDAPGIVTSNTLLIPVTIGTGGVDPEAATICIHGPGFSSYTVETPDASGHLVAELPGPPSGDITLTVTGPNIRRTSVVIPLGTGPSLVLEGVEIDDPQDFGHLSPGGAASVFLTLGNQGTVDLSDVGLSATLLEGPAQVIQSSVSYGDMPAGSSSQGAGSLQIVVDPSASTGDIVRLDLSMSSYEGNWSFELPLLVYAPGLVISTCSIDDSAGGNGNGYAEAGESFDLLLDIANIGLLDATDVTASIPAGPSWLEWTAPSASVPSIPADGTGTLVLGGALGLEAPEVAVVDFMVDIEASPGWAGQDTLLFIVGDFGMSEDVESGSPGWTHSGTGDLWHIASAAGHSGTHSWRCADPVGGGYEPEMDAILSSPPVSLAPAAGMTFWAKFDIALYGGDGLYVILTDVAGADRDTLDFIGAGGLLGSGSGQSRNDLQWLPRTYDLSGLREPGSEVRIEFSFHSDSDDDVGPGFWVDDITLDGCYAGSLGAGGSLIPGAFSMGAPSPNPGTGVVHFSLTVAEAPWTVEIFDMSGRLLRRQSGSDPFCGEFEIGLPDASPGIYFVRARAGGMSEARSFVIL